MRLLAVVLAEMGMGFAKPAGEVVVASLGSGGECPRSRLDDIDPADESVQVRGIAKLPLFGLFALDTASESEAGEAGEAGEPLRLKDSMVAEEAVFGDVTRDNGAELELSRAAELEDAEPGLEDPFRLLSETEAREAALNLFLLEAAPRAPTLLEEEPSSGMSGIPADRNCGYAES